MKSIINGIWETLLGIFLDVVCLLIILGCLLVTGGILDVSIYIFEGWPYATMCVLLIMFLFLFCCYNVFGKVKLIIKKIVGIVTKGINPKAYKNFGWLSVFSSSIGVLIVIDKVYNINKIDNISSILSLIISALLVLVIGTIIFYCVYLSILCTLNISFQLCKKLSEKVKR